MTELFTLHFNWPSLLLSIGTILWLMYGAYVFGWQRGSLWGIRRLEQIRDSILEQDK